MAKIKHIAAAFVFAACTAVVPANKANAVEREKTEAPAAPTMDALVTLEKGAYGAWKSKDGKFWDTFLSDKFVGYGSSGRLDKASATQEYTGAGCEINSYGLSDGHVTPLSTDVALVTYKATVDGTCDGQRVPASSWAASVYVRNGDQWKKVFHAQSPVVDPTVAAVKPLAHKGAPEAFRAEPAVRDAGTDALLAVERTVWEDWRAHDAKKLEGLTAKDISFINIFGTYLATKADALKNWSGAGCEVKGVSVTDPVGTMLSPTVGILTFTGSADGTCYGQTVGPIWGTSVYVKDGKTWKWAFGINTPARTAGA